MTETGQRWSDHQLDVLIGNLLRAGVFTAAGVVAFGAILFLAQEGSARPEYQNFTGEPPQLEQVSDIAATALQGDGKAVIQFGLLLLIATRVALLLIVFVWQRDGVYVMITCVVLAVLLLSLAGLGW